MARLSLEVFLAVLKAEKISPTPEDKMRIVAKRQGQGLCRIRGSFLGRDLDFDRIALAKPIAALPGLV